MNYDNLGTKLKSLLDLRRDPIAISFLDKAPAGTHGATMPAEKQEEMKSTVGQMISLRYLKAEEVGMIPHRNQALRVAVYAPLAKSSVAPDVVIVRGHARHLMMLNEASMAAGIGSAGGIGGRPTCAFIPGVIDSGRAIASLGCIGNRVYTELADDEMYFAIPGSRIADFIQELEKIVSANVALRSFHEERASHA